MSHSERREPREVPDREPRIDAWPANPATEPSAIIERVKKVVETRRERGEDQGTATEDVVQDLAEQDVRHLLEKASNWIAVVGIEPVSGDGPAAIARGRSTTSTRSAGSSKA